METGDNDRLCVVTRGATATLTYPLPECAAAHRAAVNGQALCDLLWEFDQAMRDKTKYGASGDPLTPGFAEARERLFALARDRGLEWQSTETKHEKAGPRRVPVLRTRNAPRRAGAYR